MGTASQHASPTAISYARSLLELANEQKQAGAIGKELTDLRMIVDGNPSFREILTNPSISVDERAGLLDRIFRGKISTLLFNTVGVLNRKNRLGLLSQIEQAYSDLLDEQSGKVEVDLTVAQKLTDDQLQQAKQRIGAAIGREPVIHQYVDENIIGGVVVRVGDKLIDASVRYQLAALKEQMLAATAK